MAARRLLATAAVALAALALSPAAYAASPPRLLTTQWSLRVAVGAPARLMAQAVDPDGDAITFTWTFDDGTTVTGERAVKTWTVPGSHSATLTATDATGLSARHAFTIDVVDAPAGTEPLEAPPAGVMLRRPGPAAAATARVTVGDGPLRLSAAGAIAVRLTCAPLADCTGRISVALRGRRLGGRRIAAGAYALRAGASGAVRLRVAAAARQRVRRRAPVAVVVTLAPDGRPTVRAPGTLVAR